MARIGATLSGIERSLLNRLAQADAAVALGTLRLATGRKINTPADDPAAFITLSRFQNQLNAVTATMSNVTAASSLVSQTQTTLGQIRDQLELIREELLTDEDRSLSEAEREAAQANIDKAIDQINALASTSIDGRRVLEGSADFLVRGRDPNQITNVRVHAIVPGSTPTISGSVIQRATQAQRVYTGSGGKITDDATFTLTGSLGSIEVTVHGGAEPDDLDDVAQSINDQSHKTGITASVDGDELTFRSVGYGTSETVQIEVTSGLFSTVGTGVGTNAVVQINGRTYNDQRVQGNRVTVNENGLRYELEFAPTFLGAFDPVTISGSALSFALSTEPNARATLSIPSLLACYLGGVSGTLDQIASGAAYGGLDENTSRAIRIVDEALGKLTRVEGSIDGFFNAAITSSSALLSEAQDELETAIAETDGFNQEEEELLITKNQELASNATAGLAILAQQRANIVAMIQHIAGLD